jgi:hypothetical protein
MDFVGLTTNVDVVRLLYDAPSPTTADSLDVMQAK